MLEWWDVAAEASGLGFVCFVVFNPLVLSANRVDFGLLFFVVLCFIKCPINPPPPQGMNMRHSGAKAAAEATLPIIDVKALPLTSADKQKKVWWWKVLPYPI